MIRKLFAAGAVVAVAVMAFMLMTVGTGTKSAEAHVQSISGPAFISPTAIGLAEINVVAEDGHGDVRVTASAGAFASCEYRDGSPCFVYDTVGSFPFPFLYSQATVDDFFGDVDLIQLTWGMAEGFPGGAVLFTACQFDQNCPENAKTFTMQVGGAPATIELTAQRGYTNEGESSVCADTPVYVIAAVEYSFNNATTFDNNRAIICAEVRDSVGHPLSNEQVAWTVTGGGCLDDAVTNTGGNGVTHNRLESCATGNSGDVATVTANAGVISNAVTVEFGGDPASCSIPVIDDLDIGDSAHVVATFVDELGNKVPDGIVAHMAEVDSGDGADNVEFVSVVEDTVNSQVEGDIIAAISGDTTIAVSLETIAGADVTCTETIHLTGDIHQTPGVCDDEDFILYGNQPPANGGFGTFAFCGGTYDQLLEASGCPEATSAFFYNTPEGDFIVWIPGSDVEAVNADFYAEFPQEHTPIPEGTIFTAKCV